MSSAAVYDAFEVTLRENWTDTALVFENEFAQDLMDAGSPFVYVEIYGDELRQETVGAPGANMWLETGWTYLHVMTKSGDGSRQARIWASKLLGLFREQPIVVDGITGEALFMPEMSIGAGDPGTDFPNYWAMTATIRWRRRDVTVLPTP